MQKKISLGVIMDPIAGINFKKDSTLAILLAAQKRGLELYYMEPRQVWLAQGQVQASWHPLTVYDDPAGWFTLGTAVHGSLAELDVILMRKDPPFDMEYLYATYLLELVEAQGTLVVNRASGLRDANEKLATAWFAQCAPPTLVTCDMQRIREFLQQQGEIILKPLDSMGGDSIFRVTQSDPNTGVILETMTRRGTRTIMAQRFLPEYVQGDKRILLIDGEPVPYALARIPSHGEGRANLAAGGRGEGVALTDRDRFICAEVAPTLRQKGLLFVGLDVIGEYLTEVNVTSPTCIRELDALYALDIGGMLIDAICTRLGA